MTMRREPPADAPAPRLPEDLERLARARYAQALEQLSPRTHARLAQARHAGASPAPRRHRLGWALAGTAAAVALVATLELPQPPSGPASGPPLARTAAPPVGPELDEDVAAILATLEEAPDFYLWLAANDDALPPPKER